MVLRVKLEKNKVFSGVALVSVTVYTLVFVAWLIYVEVVRFDHGGKVCSGHYLTEVLRETQPNGYAVRQGLALKRLIIGMWCANGGIVVLAIVAECVHFCSVLPASCLNCIPYFQ